MPPDPETPQITYADAEVGDGTAEETPKAAARERRTNKQTLTQPAIG
jgi:hypothetical protein